MNNNWAINYVDRVNAKEEQSLLRKKKRIIKELNAVSKQLRRKRFWKEYEYVETKIIPYVERMAHYPGSYREMVEVFKELLI